MLLDDGFLGFGVNEIYVPYSKRNLSRLNTCFGAVSG